MVASRQELVSLMFKQVIDSVALWIVLELLSVGVMMLIQEIQFLLEHIRSCQ